MGYAELKELALGTKLWFLDFAIQARTAFVHAEIVEVEVRSVPGSVFNDTFRSTVVPKAGELKVVWQTVDYANCFLTKEEAETELRKLLDQLQAKLAEVARTVLE